MTGSDPSASYVATPNARSPLKATASTAGRQDKGKAVNIRDPLVRQIMKHEGSKIENGRHVPYRCPSGKITIGYGRNLEDKKLSEVEALMLLRNDISDAREDVMYCLSWYEIAPWTVCNARMAALIDMAFCHGRRRLMKYERMFAAIKREDWDEAANELVDSQFGRTHLLRSGNLARQMREGRYV